MESGWCWQKCLGLLIKRATLMNVKGSKFVKLWVLRPYGHGWKDYRGNKTQYVDYFLEDLARALVEQDKVGLLEKYIDKVRIGGGKDGCKD